MGYRFADHFAYRILDPLLYLGIVRIGGDSKPLSSQYPKNVKPVLLGVVNRYDEFDL